MKLIDFQRMSQDVKWYYLVFIVFIKQQKEENMHWLKKGNEMVRIDNI